MNQPKNSHNAMPQATSQDTSQAIAIIGVSALFPGSTEVGGFWQDIIQGRDQIRDVPPEHWLIDDYYDPDPTAPDKTYGKRGAFLEKVPFDPMSNGMPPNTIQQTDTSQLLGMIVAQKVLDDAAGGSFTHIDKSRVSVILGATGTTELVVHLGSRLQRPIWLKALRENGIVEDEAQAICDQIADSYVPWTEASFPGLLGNVIAGRIANRFDLGGTNCVVDAACASSLSALAMGLSELHMGQSDMVIAGGVDTLNDILMYMCFSKTPALSPTGDCRPFSEGADGTILGEGVGLLALRRLEDAERDGDPIYGVIRGLGSSSDGTGTAIYAPKSSGQANALRRAYEQAGYSPRTVELLEAHGTATKAGDLAEFQGASSVFGEVDPDDSQWCAIGSVKSQIGHTKGAAGAASLIKAVLALHHKILPPTIKVDHPNPNLDVENSPFYISTEARPWVRDESHPRRAGVSSFGFGGSNFHITLEEYTGSGARKDRHRPSPTELFLLGADSAERLIEMSNELTTGFGANTEKDDTDGFQFLARETQINFRQEAPARLAIVAKNFTDLRTRLASAATAIGQDPAKAQQSPMGWHYSGLGVDGQSANQPGQIAFLFPGQGSQYVGMGTDLALAFSSVQSVWDAAANVDFAADQKLHEIVFPIPVFSDEDRARQESTLRETQWAQPAIGVTSLGHLTLLSQLGITPDCVGGHSFGEVTALHAAGVLDRDEFFAIARKRGELMADAAETLPAAMTAVFHDAAQVEKLLTAWDVDVVIGNHNSPQQVVISGPTIAIESTETKLGQESIRFQRLPVSTAFHSEVVSPATAPFQEFLDQLPMAHPWLPVYANSTAALYPTKPESMRETLAEQIAKPVLFAQQIEAMYEAGVRTFVEVGPSTVLSTLVTTCLGDRPHTAISLDRKKQHGLTSLWHGIAQLVMAGVPMQLANLWESIAVGDDPRTRVTPKLAIDISGVNYNKPYPPEGGSAALPAPNRTPKALPVAETKRDEQSAAPQKAAPYANGASTMPAAPSLPQTSLPTTPSKPSMSPQNGGRPQAAPEKMAPAIPPATPKSVPATPHAPAQQERSVGSVGISADGSQWVGAVQNLQQQTADAHMSFLRVAEQSMKSLEAMLTAQPNLAPASTVSYATAPAPIAPQVRPPETRSAPVAPPAPAPPQPIITAKPPEPPAAVPVPATVVNQKSKIENQPSHDLHTTMLEVVSEKTGYPTEMLEPSMSLSADLGIDSIKRVEILAAMRERVPTLPEFDPNEMAALNTLDEIVTYMDSALGAAPSDANSAVAEQSTANGQQSTANSQPSHDLHAIMLEVVSEKTGYPTEMLEPSMSLSADLGIDSIKRVEILAAMRERVPTLPEFDPNEMAALNTLDEIVVYMDSALGTAPSDANSLASDETKIVNRQSSIVNLHTTMLEVVSEKTGYPTEMLEPSMSLSADLGIDSIKRVEILAAMRERVPTLPEFDPNEMAALNTLDEIVIYMDSALGAAPSGANPSASESSIVNRQSSTPQLGRYVLETVERPALGFAPPFLVDGTPVYVTDDGGGVAEALVDLLRRAGANVSVCASAPADARSVVSLAGLGVASNPQEATKWGAAGFSTAISLAKNLEADGGLFVTVQETGGDHGLASDIGQSAWLGGFSGLAKTAAQEWPKAVVRSIDIGRSGAEPAQEVAARLAAELLSGGDDLEIGLPADGRRLGFASVARAADASAAQPVVDGQSVIVVSGGGRGVTAATIIELARESQAKFALLGRSVLEEEPEFLHASLDDAALKKAFLAQAQASGEKLTPKTLTRAVNKVLAAREVRATLDALAAAGSEAAYIPCDVTDVDSSAAALQSVRKAWGPITGIVHGAGVLADKRLAEKSADDFQRVFGTKVLGLHSLLTATQDDPLALLCFFSSVAARAGNAGQADYAMANEVLNRVALAESKRRGAGCVVKSIGWGPWEGGMVTPLLKAKFAEMGVELIPIDAGAHSFVTEVQQASVGEVDVVIGGGGPQGGPQDGPLLGSTQTNTEPLIFDVTVSAESHPYLYSHQINGSVVLPLVTVQEWFVGAAGAVIGEPFRGRCHNLRVLKGMPLPAFETEPTHLRIQLQPEQDRTMQAMLFDQDGVPRFAAQLIVADAQTVRGSTGPAAPAEWPTVAWHGADLYGTKLFHGPDFAALQSITRLGDSGAEALLVGSEELGWNNKNAWATDPGLVDGGLQLARVWGLEQLQQLTLPTTIGDFVLYQPGLFNPNNEEGRTVRCLLQGQIIGSSGTRCNLWFVDDASGEVVAEIHGLEMYVSSEMLIPSATSAVAGAA